MCKYGINFHKYYLALLLRDTDLDVSSPLLGKDVQPEEVQRVLRDGRALRDWRPPVLHVAQELVEERPPLRVLVHLVQPVQAVRLAGGAALQKQKKTKSEGEEGCASTRENKAADALANKVGNSFATLMEKQRGIKRYFYR